jgi:hypothetical protein
MLAKSLLIWAAIIPLAILNGALRELILVRHMSPSAARLASGLILSAAIIILVSATVHWFGHGKARDFLLLGATWLALTVLFEFGFGRLIAGRPWPELLRAYTFQGGDIWPIVLLTVASAPYLAGKLRGIL